jgi:hypothetical protein
MPVVSHHALFNSEFGGLSGAFGILRNVVARDPTQFNGSIFNTSRSESISMRIKVSLNDSSFNSEFGGLSRAFEILVESESN